MDLPKYEHKDGAAVDATAAPLDRIAERIISLVRLFPPILSPSSPSIHCARARCDAIDLRSTHAHPSVEIGSTIDQPIVSLPLSLSLSL